MKIITIFLLLILPLNLAFSSTITTEEQENNIDLAQQYFKNKNYYMAEQTLLKNIKHGDYYLPTYSLLVDLYQFGEQYKKTLKIIYFILKKEHTNRILEYSVNSNIRDLLKTISKPRDEILQLYKTIAEIYLKIVQKKIYKQKYSKSLEKKALKYFSVLDFYNYDQLNTKFNVGLIYYNSSKFNRAIKLFLEIKKLYFKLKIKDQGTLDQIYYYLGTALVQVGKATIGEIYLNRIYYNKKSDANMKKYAQQFTDYLKEDYVSFSSTLGYNYASNLNNLQDSDLDNFVSLYKDFYGEKKGSTRSLSFSGSLTKKLSEKYIFKANSGYSQSNVTKSVMRISDSKSISFASSLDFHNSKNILYSFDYSYYISYARESKEGALGRYNNSHSLTFSLTHLFLNGKLTYSIPYSISNFFTIQTTTKSYSLSLNYTPYSKSKLWSPTYIMTLGKNDETSVSSKTTSLNLALSNIMILGTRSYLAPYLSISKNINIDPNFDYLEINPSVSFGYTFKTISLLSFNLTSSYLKRIYSSDQTKNFNIGTSFSLSF